MPPKKRNRINRKSKESKEPKTTAAEQNSSGGEYSDELPFATAADEKKGMRLRSEPPTVECEIPVLQPINQLQKMTNGFGGIRIEEPAEKNSNFGPKTKIRWNGKFASENFFINSEAKNRNFAAENELESIPNLDFADLESQLEKYRKDCGPTAGPEFGSKFKKGRGPTADPDFSCEFKKDRGPTADLDFGSEFKRWFVFLAEGNNLLFFGFGSKIEILEKFAEQMLADYSLLTVRGYDPTVDQWDILLQLTKGLQLDTELVEGRPNESAIFAAIAKELESKDSPDVTLIIHNIDGPQMRSPKIQSLLAKLAGLPRIHIVASIDDQRASLMWNQSQMAALKFLWIKANSGIPYNLELLYAASSGKCKGILAQSTGFLIGDRLDHVHTLQSLESIWASLNENARKIFQLLVEDFFDNANVRDRGGKKAYDGMEFWDLYRKCRDQFLVTSETALRTQLVEFKDHQILELKRSPGGLEYLKFGLDRALLREFGTEQGLIQIDDQATDTFVDGDDTENDAEENEENSE